MALNKGKHVIEEIDGTRCTIVEKGLSPERAEFLQKLLLLNGYTVKTTLDSDQTSLKLGVTDILFNPIIDIYQRRLKSPSGKRITPAYWLQQSDQETESDVNYWKTS